MLTAKFHFNSSIQVLALHGPTITQSVISGDSGFCIWDTCFWGRGEVPFLSKSVVGLVLFLNQAFGTPNL